VVEIGAVKLESDFNERRVTLMVTDMFFFFVPFTTLAGIFLILWIEDRRGETAPARASEPARERRPR
jgi:hypothetical protein